MSERVIWDQVSRGLAGPVKKRRRKLAPRKPRRPRDNQAKLNLPVPVTLKFRHDINGIPYGPGTVTVSRALAAVLTDNESRVVEQEAVFRGTRAAIIGPLTPSGHRAHFVRPEVFEGAYGDAVPALTVSGQHLNDTGTGERF